MKRISFFLVLVLEGLVGLHRTIQLQLLQHYFLGHRHGLLWYERFALERNRDHSVIFEIAPRYCILDSFVDCDGYSISSKGFFPTVVEFNSPIQIHFWSLIPKMSVFTLVISYLTTSNLPWFMDLTFHVSMQYYFYSIGLYFHHQSHPQLSIVFALSLSLQFSGVISTTILLVVSKKSTFHYLLQMFPQFASLC